MLRNALWSVVLLGLLAGCSDNGRERASEGEPNKAAQPDSVASPHLSPLGTWVMYAGSQTGTRTAEDFEKEVTILVLEDSTYTLTMMQPQIQLNFVEKGRVDYDTRNQVVTFSVFSAVGIDFSGEEPRKLVDVDQVVPWQRDPGTVYPMLYELNMREREVLTLSMENYEDSYFVRMKPSDAGGAFNAKMVPDKGQ